MAHKTLINGTSYNIAKGQTLVSGTSYDIAKGKTLISSTDYDILFAAAPAPVPSWDEDISMSVTYGEGVPLIYSRGVYMYGQMNGGVYNAYNYVYPQTSTRSFTANTSLRAYVGGSPSLYLDTRWAAISYASSKEQLIYGDYTSTYFGYGNQYALNTSAGTGIFETFYDAVTKCAILVGDNCYIVYGWNSTNGRPSYRYNNVKGQLFFNQYIIRAESSGGNIYKYYTTSATIDNIATFGGISGWTKTLNLYNVSYYDLTHFSVYDGVFTNVYEFATGNLSDQIASTALIRGNPYNSRFKYSVNVSGSTVTIKIYDKDNTLIDTLTKALSGTLTQTTCSVLDNEDGLILFSRPSSVSPLTVSPLLIS